MTDGSELFDRLRIQLLGQLHLGRLKTGDRLPSIRQVARERGLDHRAVARAYDALAADGLVEIRGRSGVYVAAGGGSGGLLDETTRWIGEVVTGAWLRRIPLIELPRLLERIVAKPLRCACVESTEDHEVALGAELEADFGLVTERWRLARGSDDELSDGSRIDDRLGGVDLAVTTAFHGPMLLENARRSGTPVVVAAVNPDLVAAVERRFEEGPLTVVVADPLYQERATRYLGPRHARQAKILLADQPEAREAAANPEGVLFTRAARRRLGLGEFHLLPEAMPFIAMSSAREIAELMIRLTLGAPSER